MPRLKVHIINNRYVCIAHINKTPFAAVVSSYFTEKDSHFPLFMFPEVGFFDKKENNFEDDGFISRMIGVEVSVLINNALAKVGGCEYVIYAGLSEAQKSYFNFPKEIKIIEIANVEEVFDKLNTIGITKKNELRCRERDVLRGLFEAHIQNKRLVLDDTVEMINATRQDSEGVIVVEAQTETIAGITAVNYAIAVGADIEVVPPLEKDETYNIQKIIQKWRETGGHNQLQKVLKRIERRVGHVNFKQYSYVTFFTDGLPYSLGIDNCIPCSYVHLAYRADLFIFNSILYEGMSSLNSAVVFSLEEFYQSGESKWLIDFLKSKNYFVRAQIGHDATVRNLDFDVQHFPYDIFHISSHGGEVKGYAVTQGFTDRKGIKHLVEYDEVVGFSPVPGKDLVQVARKTFFKTFDGFRWMSSELKAQKYAQYVYEDMRKAFYQNDKDEKDVKREPSASSIARSCSIQCSDSIHQGGFHSLAAHSSPFIFNNACQSWYEVSKFFLSGGARGYIGTLWNITNPVATRGAGIFYENLIGETILSAFHKILIGIETTIDKNIYIFWGLHFTTVSISEGYDKARMKLLSELIRSLFSWMSHVEKTKNKDVKKNSLDAVKYLQEVIESNFAPQDLKELDAEIEKRVKDLRFEQVDPVTRNSSQNQLEDQASMDHPVRFVSK